MELGSDIAISLEGVRKSFAETTILKNLDLKIKKNKITTLVGFSGSGKSTILKIIIGLYKADFGKVEVFGHDRSAMKDDEVLLMRRKFGMLFQEAALFDDMDVFENVAFPIREHVPKITEKQLKSIVNGKLEAVGLDSGYEKLPSQLSGGMKKRVGLARAIALEPEVILYDEPTTGLDPIMTDMVNELILKTAEITGGTSVIISHDIPSTLKISDEIAFLHEGMIYFTGTPDEFICSNDPLIKRFFKH